MKKRNRVKSLGLILLTIALIAATLPACSSIRRSSNQSTAIFSNETIFYITRHAETEANINGLLVGSGGDSPLTAKGQEQANALGKGLYGIHFDKCFTSEMGRAQNTAKTILDQSNNKNIKIETDPGLNDLNWGSLEGKSITEVAAGRTDFKIEDVIGDGADPNFTSESGSETRYTCTKRLTEAMDQLAKDKNNKGKRILITAHSSMAWFIGNVTGDGAKYASIDNASVSVLIYKNQKWKVMDFNDTDYSTMKERLSKY
ncbi:MAG: histidine phosphatase family protein [Lachnospiraceae bacterium]|nr:histidine phosphatase family protein [Lachnospiraceae bacterium]